jgi:predicted phage terminase large subunit-like protein
MSLFMPHWYDELLRHDLPTFIGKTLQTVHPGAVYLPNWHIDLIAEYLEAARHSQIKRLIINMPPRSLKSVCISVAWPAWLLGKNPKNRILAASYAASLSIKHSMDCRHLIASSWYRHAFPGVVLSRDQKEKHKFATTERGFRMATSVGGSTTGEGGNFLIIDDPLSSYQALSQTCRETANRWFDHTFVSRLDDKRNGVIILVMQRLHQNDLTGYLLAKGGWEHLSLPALELKDTTYCFGNFYKERKAGELLHAAREDAELIARAKIELGSHAFAAQYQQQPFAEEALIRRSWMGKYTNLPLIIERTVQSWDTAIKSDEIHDASVCLTFFESAGQSYLVEAKLFRYEYPDLKRMLYALAERWQPDVILIEDKASGQQLLQDARRDSALPVIAIKPKADKLTRFYSISGMIEAGRLMLPEQAPWLADFESELYGFPNSKHNDRVDALTQYLNWLKNSHYSSLRIRNL